MYNYNGKVIFLIDGLSFSTTADFCAVAKTHNRGKFIGEETGGAFHGNTSGSIEKTILPNSKITIFIPKYMYTNFVRTDIFNARGTIPDYPVFPTIQEILNGEDVQLKYLLKILR
jgi:C-terminal processing protease CtpA/Prc